MDALTKKSLEISRGVTITPTPGVSETQADVGAKQTHDTHETHEAFDPKAGNESGAGLTVTTVGVPDARPNAALGRFAFTTPDLTALKPAADTPYATTVTFDGKRVPLEVTFTSSFVESLAAKHATINLVDATYTIPADAISREYTRPLFQGADQQPWQMYVAGQPMTPKGKLIVDGAFNQAGAIPTACCGKTFFEIEPFDGPPPSEATHAPMTELPSVQREIMTGVSLIAPNEKLAARAQQAFDEVCGKSAAGWAQQRERLEANKAAAHELIDRMKARLSGGGGDYNALINEGKAMIGDSDSRSRPDMTLMVRAIEGHIKSIEMAQKPVQLVVVPEGKHWTSMQHLFKDMEVAPYFRGGAMDPYSRAAVNQTKKTTVVFMPAEDLEGPQRDSRHELYHVVDLVYLFDSPLRKDMDRIFNETNANGGPWARTYGTTRIEFPTTMGELFEGTVGPKGKQFLEDNQEELAKLFTTITGRS